MGNNFLPTKTMQGCQNQPLHPWLNSDYVGQHRLTSSNAWGVLLHITEADTHTHTSTIKGETQSVNVQKEVMNV